VQHTRDGVIPAISLWCLAISVAHEARHRLRRVKSQWLLEDYQWLANPLIPPLAQRHPIISSFPSHVPAPSSNLFQLMRCLLCNETDACMCPRSSNSLMSAAIHLFLLLPFRSKSIASLTVSAHTSQYLVVDLYLYIVYVCVSSRWRRCTCQW
jgi:hypothetical protein